MWIMVELKSAMAPPLREGGVAREVPWFIPSERAALDERRHGPSLSAGSTGVSGA